MKKLKLSRIWTSARAVRPTHLQTECSRIAYRSTEISLLSLLTRPAHLQVGAFGKQRLSAPQDRLLKPNMMPSMRLLARKRRITIINNFWSSAFISVVMMRQQVYFVLVAITWSALMNYTFMGLTRAVALDSRIHWHCIHDHDLVNSSPIWIRVSMFGCNISRLWPPMTASVNFSFPSKVVIAVSIHCCIVMLLTKEWANKRVH